MCRYLRALLQGAAAGQPNCWVREKCHVYSVQSILQRKRMIFCRSICKMVGRLDTADSDLPGLLWGTGRDDRMHQIDGHGQLSRTANPWLRQFIADARDAVAIAALDNMRTDPRTWMENARYASSKFEEMLSFEAPGEAQRRRRPPVQMARLPCPRCGYLCADRRGLRVHETQTHLRGTQQALRMEMLCVANSCIWCDFRFAERRNLRDHVRSRDASGHCPQPSKACRTPLLLPPILRCPRCGWLAATLADLLCHVRTYADTAECVPLGHHTSSAPVAAGPQIWQTPAPVMPAAGLAFSDGQLGPPPGAEPRPEAATERACDGHCERQPTRGGGTSWPIGRDRERPCHDIDHADNAAPSPGPSRSRSPQTASSGQQQRFPQRLVARHGPIVIWRQRGKFDS